MATYTVRGGDNLSRIAKKYNVSVSAIVKANGISNPNLIHPGQKLNIPRSTSQSRVETKDVWDVIHGTSSGGSSAAQGKEAFQQKAFSPTPQTTPKPFDLGAQTLMPPVPRISGDLSTNKAAQLQTRLDTGSPAARFTQPRPTAGDTMSLRTHGRGTQTAMPRASSAGGLPTPRASSAGGLPTPQQLANTPRPRGTQTGTATDWTNYGATQLSNMAIAGLAGMGASLAAGSGLSSQGILTNTGAGGQAVGGGQLPTPDELRRAINQQYVSGHMLTPEQRFNSYGFDYSWQQHIYGAKGTGEAFIHGETPDFMSAAMFRTLKEATESTGASPFSMSNMIAMGYLPSPDGTYFYKPDRSSGLPANKDGETQALKRPPSAGGGGGGYYNGQRIGYGGWGPSSGAGGRYIGGSALVNWRI